MTDPTPIPPALSPEEWAEERATRYLHGAYNTVEVDVLPHGERRLFVREWFGDEEQTDADETIRVHPEALHALAALALHGQPFGFTRAEYDALRMRADARSDQEHALAQHALAKIAALLPPQ